MQISALRDDVGDRLLGFAWDQWAQLGVSASSSRHDRWAADPEALLLFTLEVARDDARLFDEVLDWLVVNEALIGVRRLRTLAHDDEDRELLEPALDWVARRRPRARLAGKRTAAAATAPRALFRRAVLPAAQPDGVFLAHGWRKPTTEPSGKSQPPDPRASICFAFRMRQLLGVGVRAEVMRLLLTTDAPRVTAQVVADSAAFAKRNVHEALGALRAAGVVDAIEVRNELRYSAPKSDWARLLGLDASDLPEQRDWPQLLRALTRIARWLRDERNERLSDYMLASDARVLMQRVGPDLRYAGVRIWGADARGADYWEQFAADVRAAVDSVEAQVTRP